MQIEYIDSALESCDSVECHCLIRAGDLFFITTDWYLKRYEDELEFLMELAQDSGYCSDDPEEIAAVWESHCEGFYGPPTVNSINWQMYL